MILGDTIKLLLNISKPNQEEQEPLIISTQSEPLQTEEVPSADSKVVTGTLPTTIESFNGEVEAQLEIPIVSLGDPSPIISSSQNTEDGIALCSPTMPHLTAATPTVNGKVTAVPQIS